MSGNEDKKEEYEELANNRKKAIQAVLWSENTGTWHDWDLNKNALDMRIFVSNVMPFYVGCYHDDENVEEKLFSYLKVSKRVRVVCKNAANCTNITHFLKKIFSCS